MIDLIGAAAASVTAAKEAFSVAVGARDAHISQSAVIEVTDKLFQAQAQLSQVFAAVIEKDGTIASLSQRVRELEAQQTERARYELKELTVSRGVFAYSLKPATALTERADEPPHFICQPCFDGPGRKVVLQRGTHRFSINKPSVPVMGCPACKGMFALG